MTASKTFVDTNVLLYLFDAAEADKQERARIVLDELGVFVVSTQVLGEFYVIATRKLKPPLPPADAGNYVDWLSRRHVVGIDATMVRAAVETSQRSQISYWDALIVEAAVRGGCSQILSEDLNAGQIIRGVEIVNPFVD